MNARLITVVLILAIAAFATGVAGPAVHHNIKQMTSMSVPTYGEFK